jgi:copper oxidase (laccase) domain-containing protein
MLWETFPELDRLGLVRHAFTRRDDAEQTRADHFTQRCLQRLGFDSDRFAAAEQPHGGGVAVVTGPAAGQFAGVDGLLTRVPALPLVIRCADCAAVYLVNQPARAIGLLHSGRNGTLANIAGRAIQTMTGAFAADPRDCVALISPSIGPCHYEMDIWTGIEQQLRDAGVREIFNPRVCTACRLDRYYSYRAEKGQTGRMIAVLALDGGSNDARRAVSPR